MKIWIKFVLWLARDEMAYMLEENQELRYENERWRHRYEGVKDALRVFEARHNALWQATVDAKALELPEPIILPRKAGQD